MEKIFYGFYPKHQWRELQIEPAVHYYSFKLLEENDPIVSDSRYTVSKGTKPYDIVPYLNWSQFLISERLKNVLEEGRFNGFKCFPAEIEGVTEKYYGWLNINEAGPIVKEDRDADIVWFDLNTWKDYDVFHLKETYTNICTKEVKEAIENAAITNIEFSSKYIGVA